MRTAHTLFAALAVALLSSCAMVNGVNGTSPNNRASTNTSGNPETIYERKDASVHGQQAASATPGKSYTRQEILDAGKGFFGEASQDFARVIERAFSDFGEPVAYIEGEEGSGAFVAGLRYGQGYFQQKGGARRAVFWQGPSIGFDFGANASKVFTLIYNLENSEQLFQRFPGMEGSVYVVAGFGLNYQKSGSVVLAPIRTGVGLRGGANVGYVHYTREPSVIPF